MLIHIFTSLLLCVIITNCFVTADDADSENSSSFCVAVDHRQGECILFKECEELYKLIETKPVPADVIKHLRKSHCGFRGTDPKVCCPIATEPGVKLPDFDVCGISLEGRVVNGDVAELGGYPWLSLLEYQKPRGTGFHCGGALISDRYVLTAAHCVSGKDIPDNWNLFSVRLGEHNTTSNPDCEGFGSELECAAPVVNVAIEEKLVHENYDPNDVNQNFDIALLRLTKTISFSDFIIPICLPTSHDMQSVTFPLSVAGWGAKRHSEGKVVKQNGVVSLTNKDACQSTSGREKIQMRDDRLCAAPTRYTQNTCIVDSGGVMATNSFLYPTGNYFAIGVMSLGPKNCSSTEPVVYTKVYDHLEWIKRTMKP